MHPQADFTLELTQLSDLAVKALAPSFTSLPKTDHADGQYRLRRYSSITLGPKGINHLASHQFVQSEDINHFQGDVVRQFEELEEHIIKSDALLEMCEIFKQANHLSDQQVIDIHQMRITAIYDQTKVSPEGIHQDGFDHIAMIGIDRHNISGGELLIYNSNKESPFLHKVLTSGEVALLDDHRLWHNATPISLINKSEAGHMDVFVLTAKDL
jgi:hypothetical protein